MRFGFVTCVELGLSCMEEIYSVGGELHLAITLKDEVAREKSGRIYLDDFSKKHNIKLLKCNNINDQEIVDTIIQYNIDWLFIIGWSQIAKENILSAPQRGVLGIHPTLLPIGRGRAPIPWPIIKGHKETGVTLFKLDKGVDTGPILQQIALPIVSNETATSLYSKVNNAHCTLIHNVWPKLVSDTIQLTVQDEKNATLWPGRSPEDGEVFKTMTSTQADRLIRGVTKPYPGAYIKHCGVKYIVWSAKFNNEANFEKTFDINDDFLQFKLSDGVLISSNWEVVK